MQKKMRARDHESFGMFTAIAVLLSPIGLILGIIYLSKSNSLDRKLGEHTLTMSILVGLICFGLWLIFSPAQSSAPLITPTYESTTNITETVDSPSWDMQAAYDGISEGMTKQQVADITDRNPRNCGETESMGVIYESCSYGGVSGDEGLIVVNFENGTVTTKSKASF